MFLVLKLFRIATETFVIVKSTPKGNLIKVKSTKYVKANHLESIINIEKGHCFIHSL